MLETEQAGERFGSAAGADHGQPQLIVIQQIFRHPGYVRGIHGLQQFHNFIGGAEDARQRDSPEYLRQLYVENGIPAVFFGPADLTGPSWEDSLYERIRRAGADALQPIDVSPRMRYETTRFNQ